MKIPAASIIIATAGLITGVGSAIALQASAQQAPTPAPTAVTSVTGGTAVGSPVTTQTDTDNIQDPNGTERPDAASPNGVDTDNIQDPGGVEVPDKPSDAVTTNTDGAGAKGDAADQGENEANDANGAETEGAGE